METFQDSILPLSAFNSIFELLAGFSFAYSGIILISNYVNNQFYKRAVSHLKKSEAKKRALFRNTNISKTIRELSLEYAALYKKTFFYEKVRSKMVPIYTYAGIYSFFVLFIAALSDSQFSQVLTNRGMYGEPNHRLLFYGTLFWFSTASVFILAHLFLRPVKQEKPVGTVNIFIVQLSLLTFTFFIQLYVDPLHERFQTYLYELIIVFFAMSISLSPILLTQVWIVAGLCVKKDLANKVYQYGEEDYLFLKSISDPKTIQNDKKLFKILDEIHDCDNIEENKNKILKYIHNRVYKQAVVDNPMQAGSIVLFLCLCFLFVFRYNPPQLSRKPLTEYQIAKIIKTAAEREFMTYNTLPVIDTVWIDNYFTKKGTARVKIFDVLQDRIKDKLILSKRVSKYTFFKIKDISYENGRLLVSAKEFWFLKWYDIKKRKYIYEYQIKMNDLVNYELVNENGVWKIDISDYIGYRTKY